MDMGAWEGARPEGPRREQEVSSAKGRDGRGGGRCRRCSSVARDNCAAGMLGWNGNKNTERMGQKAWGRAQPE